MRGIDLDAPIDKIGQYATQEAPRGHFAAFEFGANLSLVHFRNIDITFHADKWPLTHLVQVGPKSCFYPGKDGKPGTEIFDPYVSCRVGRVVLENIRTRGVPPKELVHASSFKDINKDGRSTGRGVIEKIERPDVSAEYDRMEPKNMTEWNPKILPNDVDFQPSRMI